MGLSCSCEYDGDSAAWVWYKPHDYTRMPAGKRRKRCTSCNAFIEAGSVCAEFERQKNAESEIEINIYGEGYAVPLASHWLCEPCADLYFSFDELGFDCVGPTENMRELAKQYAETYQRGAGE